MNYKKILGYGGWVLFLLVWAICLFPVTQIILRYVVNTPWEIGVIIGAILVGVIWAVLVIATCVNFVEEGEILEKILDYFRAEPQPAADQYKKTPTPGNWQ